jgi:hypothetical protein
MLNVTNENTLRWPALGWERTRIQDRKKNAAWKKSLKDAKDSFLAELGRMAIGDIAIGDVVLSYNQDSDEARRDPGVAVYFSKYRKPDYSWIDALGLDTPVPTLAQINDAFQEKALLCHPDRYPDDPAKAEMFKRLTNHRQHAKDWIKGTQQKQHEYHIAADRYEEVRLNFMALRAAVAAFRTIERVGVPGILEHTLAGFKTALPAHVEGGDAATT